MARYTIENEVLKVEVDDHGAEIKSVCRNSVEYMWHGDPKFWGRSAPILFPLVGSLKDKTYRYDGKTYQMGQHGFARDYQFELEEQKVDRISFCFSENEETFAIYPFHFKLTLSYQLKGEELLVSWKVENTDEKTLCFSIGGHPAFLCPVDQQGVKENYHLRICKDGKPLSEIVSTGIVEGGLAGNQKQTIALKQGEIETTEELFLGDALILEDDQADEVSLLLPDQREYLTVKFHCPLVGIWSPPGKNAPFVCIEPWYGRCDGVDFDGDLSQRKYGNALEPGEIFETSYCICPKEVR